MFNWFLIVDDYHIFEAICSVTNISGLKFKNPQISQLLVTFSRSRVSGDTLWREEKDVDLIWRASINTTVPRKRCRGRGRGLIPLLMRVRAKK